MKQNVTMQEARRRAKRYSLFYFHFSLHLKIFSRYKAGEGKTILTYHFLTTEWGKKSKNLTIPNAGEDAKQQKLSFITGEKALWKII